MSGGHWNYLCLDLEERAQYAGSLWHLLAKIEHVLDYGITHATCYRCAQRKVILALETFFDGKARDVTEAIYILQDHEFVCEECQRKVESTWSW